MSDTELKLCPFCGKQCSQLVIDQGDKWAHYEPSCLEVRTRYNTNDDAPWIAEAITAWNTRQPDPQVTALVEAASSLLSSLLDGGLGRANQVDALGVALSNWEQSNG